MAEGTSRPEIPVPTSKNPESLKQPVNKRRGLLKGVAAIGGLLGVAALASREIQAQKEGIETKDAVFIPIYERHDVGVAEKDIPKNLDAFVREGIFNAANLETPFYRYLQGNSMRAPLPNGEVTTVRKFQEGVLERFAQDKVKIVFADINPAADTYEHEVFTPSHIAGFISGLGTFIYAKVRQVIDEDEGIAPTKQELTRRNFIKAAGYGVAAWGLSDIATGDASIAADGLADTSAVKRTITRLEGFQSNFHPEDVKVFFRNVFLANKMLALAEQVKSTKNQKMKIAFNYGSAHSGVEDLLRAGPEVCRAIINMYPKEYLKQVITENDTIENLASAVVIELPVDFKESDLEDTAKVTRIQGIRVMDKKLSHQLNAVAQAA